MTRLLFQERNQRRDSRGVFDFRFIAPFSLFGKPDLLRAAVKIANEVRKRRKNEVKTSIRSFVKTRACSKEQARVFFGKNQ